MKWLNNWYVLLDVKKWVILLRKISNQNLKINLLF